MKNSTRAKILLLLYLFLISYLLMNTGIISDDFDAMARLQGKRFIEILLPKGCFYFIETPFEYYSHYLWYIFFSIDSQLQVNIIKIFYIFLSFFLISKFFAIYLEKKYAYLVSFTFLFFPSHDSTAYWFMVEYLALSFGLYLYAFYLAYKNRLVPAFIFALLGSFISYGSPPIAASLFLLFLLHKSVKKALIILVPNIIYSVYYIYISKVASIGTDKIVDNMGMTALLKNYVMQVFSFADATLGPSMWLKIFYSFGQISVVSAVIALILIVLYYKNYKGNPPGYDRRLIASFFILTLASFGVFSLTGRYPQICFNLGNRVTIFGSLLLSYLIVLLPLPHKIRTFIYAMVIFTVFGVSDHWKNWNIHQEHVIANIRNNQDLKTYSDKKMVYVSGNQYSKYGPLSHIEFLSEGYVVAPVFQLAVNNPKLAVDVINKRHKFMDGSLVDMKYDVKASVSGHINVYDSETNTLSRIPAGKIKDYISSLPDEKRHWIQMLKNEGIKKFLLRINPRIKYIL